MGYVYMGIKHHNSIETMTFSELVSHYGKLFALRLTFDHYVGRLASRYWLNTSRAFWFVLCALWTLSDCLHYGDLDHYFDLDGNEHVERIGLAYILDGIRHRMPHTERIL